MGNALHGAFLLAGGRATLSTEAQSVVGMCGGPPVFPPGTRVQWPRHCLSGEAWCKKARRVAGSSENRQITIRLEGEGSEQNASGSPPLTFWKGLDVILFPFLS